MGAVPRQRLEDSDAGPSTRAHPSSRLGPRVLPAMDPSRLVGPVEMSILKGTGRKRVTKVPGKKKTVTKKSLAGSLKKRNLARAQNSPRKRQKTARATSSAFTLPRYEDSGHSLPRAPSGSSPRPASSAHRKDSTDFQNPLNPLP